MSLQWLLVGLILEHSIGPKPTQQFKILHVCCWWRNSKLTKLYHVRLVSKVPSASDGKKKKKKEDKAQVEKKKQNLEEDIPNTWLREKENGLFLFMPIETK